MILSALAFSLPLLSAYAYEGSQIASPTLSKAVTVDGKWTASDEWSDAVVAIMFRGSSSSGNGTAYLYAKHDARNFYFLIDYISATSLSPTHDGAGITIDSLHNGGNTPQPDDRRFDSTYPSGGRMANGTGNPQWSWGNPLPSGVEIGMSMGGSPNLAQQHEITEFQIPFSIFPGMLNTIGFAAAAYSGSGASARLAIWPNIYYRDIPNTFGELTISPSPLPEFGGVSLITAVSMLASVAMIRWRKKL